MSEPDRRRLTHRERWTGPIFALTAALALLAAEVRVRPLADDGLHLQPWTSDEMMQSVSVEDLRQEPLRSLWYLHIQPPAYDSLRALFAAGSGGRAGADLVELVDRRLYVAWAALYGLLGWAVYGWLAELTGRRWALAGAMLFLLHPATLFYATLLESTLLSALLFTLLFWRLAKRGGEARVSPMTLAALFAALYLTRSLVQWPWLLVVAGALWAAGSPRREALRFCLLAALVVVPLSIKQQALFGSVSTSSFAWMNLCRSVQGCDVGDPALEIRGHMPGPGEEAMPRVLSRRRKVDPWGSANLNHWTLLDWRDRWRDRYFARLAAMTPAELAHNYAVNLHVYLQPSSRYTRHAMVDRLPWRGVYDTLFSGRLLLALVAAAAIGWWWRTRGGSRRPALAVLLPVGALVAISVFGERIENMRFKYFLEPALFVFLAAELHHLGRAFRLRFSGEGRA